MNWGGWSTGSIITLVICIFVAIACSGFVFYLLGKKNKKEDEKKQGK